MRLKMLLVLLLLSNSLYAFELKPPAPQPGDNETITVTVGEMRQALYYYELAPLMVERIRGLNDNMNLLIKEFGYIEKALEYRQEENRLLKVSNRRYKIFTLIFALTTIGFGGILIGGAL